MLTEKLDPSELGVIIYRHLGIDGMQPQTQSSERMTRARDGALDITYGAALWVRSILRFITRPIEIGVRVLVVDGDEVLLVRHRRGKLPWSLPGGGVKAQETLEAAACREVWEEAGCTVRIERLHGIFYTFGAGFSNYTAVFIATPLAALQPPVGDLEIVDARFVPLHALLDGTDPGTRDRVAEYLRGETGLSREW